MEPGAITTQPVGFSPHVNFGLRKYHFEQLRKLPKLFIGVFILEAFECNTTSDWVNGMVLPIRSCVAFKFTNFGEKRQRMFWRMFGK